MLIFAEQSSITKPVGTHRPEFAHRRWAMAPPGQAPDCEDEDQQGREVDRPVVIEQPLRESRHRLHIMA